MLNKMGLSLLAATIGGGMYKAPEPGPAVKDTYHFRRLLRRFAGHVTNGENLNKEERQCLKRLGNDCSSYLRMKAHDCSDYAQVVSTLTGILMTAGMPQVSRRVRCEVKRLRRAKNQ